MCVKCPACASICSCPHNFRQRKQMRFALLITQGEFKGRSPTRSSWLHDVASHDFHVGRPCRDAQDSLLWNDKTYPCSSSWAKKRWCCYSYYYSSMLFVVCSQHTVSQLDHRVEGWWHSYSSSMGSCQFPPCSGIFLCQFQTIIGFCKKVAEYMSDCGLGQPAKANLGLVGCLL